MMKVLIAVLLLALLLAGCDDQGQQGNGQVLAHERGIPYGEPVIHDTTEHDAYMSDLEAETARQVQQEREFISQLFGVD